MALMGIVRDYRRPHVLRTVYILSAAKPYGEPFRMRSDSEAKSWRRRSTMYH